MKKDVPGKRVTHQAETTFMRLYEEKVDPFSNLFPLPIKSSLLNLYWSQLCSRMPRLFCLASVDPAGWASQSVYVKKSWRGQEGNYAIEKGWQARQVTLQAASQVLICFSWKRLTHFYSEMYEKLTCLV